MASGIKPVLAGGKQNTGFELVEYGGFVAIGASGAITSQMNKPASISRTAAGKYTCTLPASYATLHGFTLTPKSATATAVLLGVVVSTANLASAGTFTFEIRTEAGTCTDPTSGDGFFWTATVSDSTLNGTV